MNEMTEWKIVVGASMPRPRSLNGIQGCNDSTAKPNTNRIVLNMSMEAKYCFQLWPPLSNRDSNQRNKAGARYLPFMIHAMYRLSGIARIVVTIKIEIGKNHMVSNSCSPPGLVSRKDLVSRLEPFGANHRHPQIHKQKCRHEGCNDGQHGYCLRSFRRP